MNKLIVLSCSATKRETREELPALYVYDGPAFRLLRARIRQFGWPEMTGIAVLSAEHGLIGVLKKISSYDRCLTSERANEIRRDVAATFARLSSNREVLVVCGKKYTNLIGEYVNGNNNIIVTTGGIGKKLHQLSEFLRETSMNEPNEKNGNGNDTHKTPLYFLPDWGDLVDVNYDFVNDAFSVKCKSERDEIHVTKLMYPHRVCDGVLVSLSQKDQRKGPLCDIFGDEYLRPKLSSLREYYGLDDDQYIFGDCGAFSYVNEPSPSISVDYAVAMYDLLGVDMGASVDHIPIQTVSVDEKLRRIEMTVNNAKEFLEVHKELSCTFSPVGVLQGITPDDYAKYLEEYIKMGYRHVAVGGIVSKSNNSIREIVDKLCDVQRRLRVSPWIHLFGVYRPSLLSYLKEKGIKSFDSASYFRKAWLRCTENYMGADGKWYTAIRVPVLNNRKNSKRMKFHETSKEVLEKYEKNALNALHMYAVGRMSLNETLDTVMEYDDKLSRKSRSERNLYDKYRRTLESRVWEGCQCPVCRMVGIDVVIFRGTERNKRRGIHNTYYLYRRIKEVE